MPHITVQITTGGPILDVRIGVSQARAAALRTANQAVPNPVQIRGLIDTGASCTCIDPAVLSSLGLAPTGVSPMLTPSTGQQAHHANVYDVSLILVHPSLTLTHQNVPVAEAQLAIQGIQALIGRDVLRLCLLVYDGQSGVCTLAF
jgi:hypothetical protein